MNQKLEKYLQFFIDYRQKDWAEWLVIAEFVVSNKTYLATKVSLFIVNYGRELRMGVDNKRKGKVEKATVFAERIKKVQKEAKAVLRKMQKEMKQQANKKRRETKEQRKGDKVMLSMKDLVFKEQLAKKLVD